MSTRKRCPNGKRRNKLTDKCEWKNGNVSVNNRYANLSFDSLTPNTLKIKKTKRVTKSKVKKGMTVKALERIEIVKKIMKEKGLKLGQASKYVKENGLWKPATGEWF